MPNWCDNYMEISGEIKLIKSLIEKEEEFKFSSFYPEPIQSLYDLNFKDGQWRRDHWGCSGNPIVRELTMDSDEIWISFDTAWSPPIEFAENLVKQYPDIDVYLEFNEVGMGYLGQLTVSSNSASSLHIENNPNKPTHEYMFVYTPYEEEEE